MNLFELIKADRPTISDSSINTYVQTVKRLSPDKDMPNLIFLYNPARVLEKIAGFSVTTQRNLIISIIVALRAADKFNEKMQVYSDKLTSLTEKYDSLLTENKKTPSQEANWIEHAKLLTIAKGMIKHSPGSQNSLISALYTYQAPTRLDYYDMEIVGKGVKMEDNKNYLQVINRQKKTFIFNNYKSSKTYGKVSIPVNKQLNTVINKYIKLNPGVKYLLESEKVKGSPMTRNSLGKRIPKIFASTGKHITLNLIRHIYISENMDIEATKAQNELAKNMMHGKATQLTYAKK
jgi:hypothetical protein